MRRKTDQANTEIKRVKRKD